jgi:electron transport complex, RnfABCDGE type, G subunit
MKKLQSNILNMALMLTVIAIVAAGLLAWVNNVTSGPIEEINNLAIENGIKSVILGDRDIQFTVDPPVERDGFVFHSVNDMNGNLIGTAVESTDRNGFGGALKVMVGFDPEGVILGYTVLEHSETPGLGAQADDWFRQASAEAKEQSGVADVILGAPGNPGNHNIIGLNPGNNLLTVSKDGGEVDAITASTITSRAFLRSVNAAYKAVFGYTAADGVSGASSQN